MGNKYPECEKMAAIADKSQIINDFIEWFMNKKDIFVCKFDEGSNGYYVWGYSMEKILAEFFDIDLYKIEKERRQMLDEIRGKNE
jgi:hypothetical protein